MAIAAVEGVPGADADDRRPGRSDEAHLRGRAGRDTPGTNEIARDQSPARVPARGAARVGRHRAAGRNCLPRVVDAVGCVAGADLIEPRSRRRRVDGRPDYEPDEHEQPEALAGLAISRTVRSARVHPPKNSPPPPPPDEEGVVEELEPPPEGELGAAGEPAL